MLPRMEECSRDGGMLTGWRDAPKDGGMLLGMGACGEESGTVRQLEILLARSEESKPGLAKLLSGVNSFAGPNRAGYGRMLQEKPQS